jgi:hypothetical protein
MTRTITPAPAATPIPSWLWVSGLAILLSACGGSPSSSDPAAGTPPTVTPPVVTPPVVIPPVVTPPVSVTLSDLQGRWSSPASAQSPGYGLVTLPVQGSSASAWLLAQDGSTLSSLSFSGTSSFAVSGKTYSFTAAGTQTVAPFNTGASASLTASPKVLTLSNGGPLPSGLFTLSDALTTPATQADVAGNWRATVGQGAQSVTWTVTAAGSVSGTSTTGCTWSGSLTALTDATVYRTAMAEACSGASVQFSGIGTVNAAKTQLTVVATSADESKATVLLFAKP